MECQEINFFYLPREIQMHVFSFLSEKDLVIASLVSGLFKDLAEDPSSWKSKMVYWKIDIQDNIFKSVIDKIKKYMQSSYNINDAFKRAFPDALICESLLDQYKANLEYLHKANLESLQTFDEYGEPSALKSRDQSCKAMRRALKYADSDLVKALLTYDIKPEHEYLYRAVVYSHNHYCRHYGSNIIKMLMEKWEVQFEAMMLDAQKEINENICSKKDLEEDEKISQLEEVIKLKWTLDSARKFVCGSSNELELKEPDLIKENFEDYSYEQMCQAEINLEKGDLIFPSFLPFDN